MADSEPTSSSPGITSAEANQATKRDEAFEEIGRKVQGMRLESSGVNNLPNAPEDDDQRVVEEIESLCMNCQENGMTRLLLTRIPYFREVILMSFYCPHCHFKNTEIQSAGQIQERGSRYTFTVTKKEDLSRQVVKSDTCITKFRELELEIPPGRGQLTNIEGLLTMVIEDLEFEQPVRKNVDPRLFSKIGTLCHTGRRMLAGEEFPFVVSVDDPAGNSWIEPSVDNSGRKWTRTEYQRTPEQNEALSLGDGNNEAGDQNEGQEDEVAQETRQIVPQLQRDAGDGLEEVEIVPDEVYSFPTSCPACTKACTTNMKMVNIPHFKEVVIMSTSCEMCGYRTSEVKTGGAVPSLGRRITLKVQKPEDLGRDILKSESCALSCPELNLSVNPGTLGGRFTTVEGLLTQVRNDLRSQIFDVGEDETPGDSVPQDTRATWDAFFDQMDKAIKAEVNFSIILEDPLASSYVQNLVAPEADPQIFTEDYERTAEEEEDLGLNDMKTEGYEEEEEDKEKGESATVAGDGKAEEEAS
ncbi:MAG: hypothetical protein M4579_004170 [Chaenotheca gracillima]|nr:MAG: hypothetical protein M4579_004170 [Chaenotheca gracillima]